MPSRDRQLSPPRGSPVMPHAFRVGQLVALAQTSRDPETYEVMQLMPETPSGEPQYRIKDLGFPLWSGGFCKEPKHPRRMEWHRNEPGGGSPASIRPKRFSV